MYRFDPGATSVTVYFKLRDSSTGLAESGLTATSPGAQCAYTRKSGSATSISLVALGSPIAAWSAGGFIEVDSVKAKGLYRLDIPNAVCAAGAEYATVSLTFTGTVEEAVLINLEAPDSTVGAGSLAFTVTVTDSITALPLAGASVWVTTDVAGANVVAGTATTNALGVVVFYLDPGPYYLWVQHEGYTGTNPTSITVS